MAEARVAECVGAATGKLATFLIVLCFSRRRNERRPASHKSKVKSQSVASPPAACLTPTAAPQARRPHRA